MRGGALSTAGPKVARHGGRVEGGTGVAPFRLAELFAGLGPTPVLLAVSGGADSLALMHLASRWAGAPLHVATVDHGLRAASGAEAEGVAAAAAALGLPHATLVWQGPKPRTAIQERARTVRYALLAEHARALGAAHILAAHHADDQAETVLMRLARGSGPGGLAGMRRDTALASGVTLVRPLLGCRKADLVALCQAIGQPFLDDPSNRDPAFARARLRLAAPAAAALGLDVATLTRLAARLARAETALEVEARRCLQSLGGRQQPGRFEVAVTPLLGAEPEIVLRVLRFALAATLPAHPPPRLDRLERLAAALHEALRRGAPHRASLGGACLTLGRDTMLTIVPEPVRRRGRAATEANGLGGAR